MPAVRSGFSPEFKELVRSRTDLVDLVGESVAMRSLRGGTDYLGLCPFHDDTNPSFHVYPERQSWRCWVCQEGGDCFSFVMKKDRLEFREALEFLATRANLELPRYGATNRDQSDGRLKLYEALRWAQEEFHRYLLTAHEAAPAREYLKNRGLSEETIARFKLGYHPEDWHWLLNRAGDRFSRELLVEARLAGFKAETSSYYDNFVDRVIFPIQDERGRPISFGGRVLPGREKPNMGKYWNGPESKVFTKSRVIYALPQAKDEIRRAEMAIVTEGYTDTIACHQAGIGHAVATLGTALTELHVSLLNRFTQKVVLVYDGDSAGQSAAENAVAKFITQDIDLRILTLPESADPDDFIARQGAEEFLALATSAPDALQFKIDRTIDRVGLDSLSSRQRVLNEILQLISESRQLSGTAREHMIFRLLAERVGIEERIIRTRSQEIRQEAKPKPTNEQPTPDSEGVEFWNGRNREPTRDDKLECDVIETLLARSQWLPVVRGAVDREDFRNPSLRSLFETALDLDDEGLFPSQGQAYGPWTSALEDPELKSLLEQLENQSGSKDIGRMLDESETEHDLPAFLRRVIQQMTFRRDVHRDEQARGRLAQMTRRTPSPELAPAAAGDSSLDAESLELLRDASSFHQKRAT